MRPSSVSRPDVTHIHRRRWTQHAARCSRKVLALSHLLQCRIATFVTHQWYKSRMKCDMTDSTDVALQTVRFVSDLGAHKKTGWIWQNICAVQCRWIGVAYGQKVGIGPLWPAVWTHLKWLSLANAPKSNQKRVSSEKNISTDMLNAAWSAAAHCCVFMWNNDLANTVTYLCTCVNICGSLCIKWGTPVCMA